MGSPRTGLYFSHQNGRGGQVKVALSSQYLLSYPKYGMLQKKNSIVNSLLYKNLQTPGEVLHSHPFYVPLM